MVVQFEVKRAVPKSVILNAPDAEALLHGDQQEHVKVFVGGLSPDLTQGRILLLIRFDHSCTRRVSFNLAFVSEEFLEYFQQFGKVLEATIMTDHDSGRSRGFGFVISFCPT